MKLDETQKRTVANWIADGLKLAEIQKRVGTEFGLNLTYMEVRFLVDDLKLMPKDPVQAPVQAPSPPSVPEVPAADTIASAHPAIESDGVDPVPVAPVLPSATGKVNVTVDAVTRPGAMVSGAVQFSDGQSGSWYLDQMGRLGVVAKTPGYKPSPEDVQVFQQALEAEFSKLGF